MASSVLSKKKIKYIPPSKKGIKPVVYLDSGKFENVHKKYENLVIGGLVGCRPPFLFVKEAVQKI